VSEQSTDRAVVLITDLHRRITGVSATIRNLVPLQSEQQNVKLWSRLPFAENPRLNGWQVYKLLRRQPKNRKFHIWHARRNNEMLWALFFKVI
jgi:mannosyltransferase